ncbi:T9SS type A sorting domain-containing protein [Candidatus Kapabacteria bacterium]|nr:T9SS type A sorting domain-containing protein [Candidatus Kapabacteria bacterium]
MSKQKLFLVLTSLLGLFAQNIYSQTAPDLVAPTLGDQCVPKDVTARWSQVPNNINYHVQITETSGDYANAIVSQTITATNLAVSLPDNSSTYYWRVGAKNSNTVTYSEEEWFLTQRIGADLSAPLTDLTCQNGTTTFTWQALTDINNYNIEVSESPLFSSSEVSENTGTVTSAESFLSNGFTKYYWRVNAAYTSGTQSCFTEWSEIRNLTTAVYAPELSDPVDDSAGVFFNSLLEWESSNGATDYNLQVSTSSTFGAQDVIFDQEGITSNSQVVPLDPTLFDKEYFWRVRGQESNTCISDWSAPFSFKTQLQSTTLTSPEDLSTCLQLNNQKFEWSAIQSSNTFQFQLSDEPSFADPVLNIMDIAGSELTVDIPGDNTTYYWRVRANSGNNTSEWTSANQLLSGIFSPSPDNPVDGAQDQFIAVNLEWINQSNFSNQKLQLSRSSDFTDENIILDEEGINTTEYLAILPDYGTTYFWRISSTLGQCESGWSNTSSFTVYDGYPTLVFPENMQENLATNIFFRWTEIPGATSYDIQFSFVPDFSVVEKGRFDIDSTVYWINDLDPESKYYWRVRSVNQYSKSPWSEPDYFVTGLDDAIKAVTIYPPNNTEQIPVDLEFKWFKALNAETYEIEIAETDEFENVIFNETTIIDTTYNYSSLENFTEYFWRVRSKNKTTLSPWSNPSRFITIAPLVEEMTNLILPMNNSADLGTDDIMFQWDPIENTTDVDGGYQLQISTDENFDEADLVVDARNIFREDPTIFNLIPLATHYWRVRGWNEAGDGPWSDVFNFTTLDPSSVEDINIKLLDLYPNPSSGNLNISCNLLEAGNVDIIIFDASGSKILSLSQGLKPAGYNEFSIEKLDYPSGKYLIMIKSNNSVISYNFTIAK